MATEVFNPKIVADVLQSYAQDAVGDVASSMLDPMGAGVEEGDKWDKKIKKARKAGVGDLHGWLADELYSDPDMIEDLIGDQLHDNCAGDNSRMIEVLAYILRTTNPKSAFYKAAKSLHKSHNKE